MKKIVITLAAVAVFLIAAVANAGIQDFTIVNNTGNEIYYVYVSATISQDWEEDLLGNEIMYPNDQLQVSFVGGSNHCYWDLKIQDKDGRTQDWREIDLCTVGMVTLTYSNGFYNASW
ncbi:MAG: hypothetical protein D6E12_11925 [Desulfovibrio sp.]|nr:MAG: hypothetical protein D6E12_11925 [Desulfovibrio sp.]